MRSNVRRRINCPRGNCGGNDSPKGNVNVFQSMVISASDESSWGKVGTEIVDDDNGSDSS